MTKKNFISDEKMGNIKGLFDPKVIAIPLEIIHMNLGEIETLLISFILQFNLYEVNNVLSAEYLSDILHTKPDEIEKAWVVLKDKELLK